MDSYALGSLIGVITATVLLTGIHFYDRYQDRQMLKRIGRLRTQIARDFGEISTIYNCPQALSRWYVGDDQHLVLVNSTALYVEYPDQVKAMSTKCRVTVPISFTPVTWNVNCWVGLETEVLPTSSDFSNTERLPQSVECELVEVEGVSV